MEYIRPDTPYRLRCLPVDENGQPDGDSNDWASWAVGPSPLNASRYAWITDDNSWAPVYFSAEPHSPEDRAQLYQVIDGVRHYLHPESEDSGDYLKWQPAGTDGLLLYLTARRAGWLGHKPLPLNEPLELTAIVTRAGSTSGTASPLSRKHHGGYLMSGAGLGIQRVQFIAVPVLL